MYLQDVRQGFYNANQCMVARSRSLVHTAMFFFPCVRFRFSMTQVGVSALIL